MADPIISFPINDLFTVPTAPDKKKRYEMRFNVELSAEPFAPWCLSTDGIDTSVIRKLLENLEGVVPVFFHKDDPEITQLPAWVIFERLVL